MKFKKKVFSFQKGGATKKKTNAEIMAESRRLIATDPTLPEVAAKKAALASYEKDDRDRAARLNDIGAVHSSQAPVMGKESAPANLDSLSFSKAFANSRKSGLKEFTWRDKSYTTNTKEEAKTNLVNKPTSANIGSARPTQRSAPRIPATSEGDLEYIPIDQPTGTPAYLDFNTRRPEGIPSRRSVQSTPQQRVNTVLDVDNSDRVIPANHLARGLNYVGNSFVQGARQAFQPLERDLNWIGRGVGNVTSKGYNKARNLSGRITMDNPLTVAREAIGYSPNTENTASSVRPNRYRNYQTPHSYQQGGQMAQQEQLSEEEIYMDFAVRYLTAIGATDVIDEAGNINPAYEEEITQVLGNGIDVESYMASPDEYIAEVVTQQNPEAVQMARKGSKLRRLRGLKRYNK